ncbi:MAG: DUF3127 domain-containing protein [Muribaculaceae bacterium]
MDITGKIIYVSPVISGVSQRTGNTWASRDFVIETEEQYPQRACMRLFGQDKIDKHPINVGDVVTVSFDINATEYNGRWYNQLNAWNIAPLAAAGSQPVQPAPGQQQTAPAQTVTAQQATPAQAAAPQQEESNDALPF